MKTQSVPPSLFGTNLGGVPTSRPIPRYRVGVVLLGALLFVWSCGPATDPAVDRGLVSLGSVELSGLEEEVITAIQQQRQTVDELLADDAVEVAVLAESLADLAVLYGTSGFWDTARICYANAETLQPEEARWDLGEGMMRAAVGVAAGDWVAADEAYREVLEKDGTNLAAFRGLTMTRWETGDLSGAYEVVNAGLAVNPPEGEEFSESENFERSALFVQLGDLEFVRGSDEAGIAAMASSIQMNLDQVHLLPKIADALARLGRFEAAASQFEKYLEVNPEDPTALEKYATVLVNLGQGDKAVEAFERAVAAVPDDVGLEMRYAAALEYLDRGQDATEVKERARDRATEPEMKAQMAVMDGDAKLAEGDLEGAISHYREAKKLAPESFTPQIRLARVLGQLGRYDESAAQLDEVLAVSPRHVEAQRGQIMLLVMGRRYDQAKERLQDALQQYPRDVELALTQVRLLATVPDPAVADGALALAIAHRVYENFKNESTLEALALALAATGDFEQAIEAQKALIEATTVEDEDGLAKLDRARLATFEMGEGWIARVPAEILVDLGI